MRIGRWLALVALLLPAAAQADPPRVVIETSLGEITLELYPERAPQTVENFLAYAREGFYEGLIFHRVIPGFVIQAGGHDALMAEREPTRPPIRNEADNGLSNLRGTIAMARTRDPHSARAQFFINLADNTRLDHRHSDSASGWGYVVFGRVIAGMEVVDRIAAVPTTSRSGHEHVPVEPVLIHRVRVVDSAP